MLDNTIKIDTTQHCKIRLLKYLFFLNLRFVSCKTMYRGHYYRLLSIIVFSLDSFFFCATRTVFYRTMKCRSYDFTNTLSIDFIESSITQYKYDMIGIKLCIVCHAVQSYSFLYILEINIRFWVYHSINYHRRYYNFIRGKKKKETQKNTSVIEHSSVGRSIFDYFRGPRKDSEKCRGRF